ncbi:DUF1456 family protein [Flavobacterium sp. RHBU_24]|uniref:DUF1456 family protein n=1 Tax=Flavobacterium sp. RHBU_24 TaxID=3391185 RepID=UPI0039851F9F
MNNNDVFKKLRVALQLRDDQIVEIIELADFRISKAEVGAFFRNADHPNYMECGDQVLRYFLNGLIIHLRGTKDAPKDPQEVIAKNKEQVAQNTAPKESGAKPAPRPRPKAAGGKKPAGKKPSGGAKGKSFSKPKQEPIVERVKYNNGKNSKG